MSTNANALNTVAAVSALLASDRNAMWPDEEKIMWQALYIAQRLVK